MLTKAIIQKIDQAKNTCIVRIPLFEQASSSSFIETEATICITPGIYNNLFVGDIVIVGFEENKMELPIILGKLFLNSLDKDSKAGALFGDTLNVTTKAVLPSDTEFRFEKYSKQYAKYNTPKKLADALLELLSSEQKTATSRRYITKVSVDSSKRPSANLCGDIFIHTTKAYNFTQDTDKTLADKQRLAFLEELQQRSSASSSECTVDDEIVCLGFNGSVTYHNGDTPFDDTFNACVLCAEVSRFYIKVSGGLGNFYFEPEHIYKMSSAPI